MHNLFWLKTSPAQWKLLLKSLPGSNIQPPGKEKELLIVFHLDAATLVAVNIFVRDFAEINDVKMVR